jgi:bifunctional UDP-N-acetylglucosamine pyrophosphorylase/glucosamine-1-phosphate N-acetyltransferase
MQAVSKLNDDLPTLVLYGDVPLTTVATLRALTEKAGKDKLAILTIAMDDPTGYGRIVREQNKIVRIVEQKDATDLERQIHEVNTGILVAPTRQLKDWLSRLSNHNVQGEYYLTDIIALAVKDNVVIESTQPSHAWETLGVNSKVQLAELERIHQLNLAHQLLEKGITLADPARIDIRGELHCARDVSIDVGCVFEGQVHIGQGVSPRGRSAEGQQGRCQATDHPGSHASCSRRKAVLEMSIRNSRCETK